MSSFDYNDNSNVYYSGKYWNDYPECLEIIAETKDKTIMGIAHKNKNIYGVQFHPESLGTTDGKIILKNFLKLIKYEN